MAIVITVEDGSNVPFANSYVDLAEARDYALNRGVTLSVVDDNVAAMLIKAMDYIESKGDCYQGTISYDDQELLWPRADVYVNGLPVDPVSIPKNLKYAQCSLVLSINSGTELMPDVSASDYVIREKIGPIDTEYADPSLMGVKPKPTAAESLLSPLYKKGGSPFSSVRV